MKLLGEQNIYKLDRGSDFCSMQNIDTATPDGTVYSWTPKCM
jgi:hypothetical protein